jgi:tetratricopeptide (TPR) repeat protein
MKIINKLTLVACGLTLTIGDAFAIESSDFQKKILECNQLVKSDNTQSALEFSAQLIKQNKTSREAYVCKGRAELALGQFPEAVDTFKQVNQLSQSAMDKMMAQAMLGNAYKGGKQQAEALESYKQALAVSKTTGNKGLERVSHELIASALFLGEKYDDALAEYQIALKLAQNDGERAEIYERMAECYEHQAKLDAAIDYQIKASLAHTHYSDLDRQVNAQLELGRLYTEANSFDQAKSVIDKVLALAKDGSEYWEAKSSIYMAKLMHRMHKEVEAKELLVSAEKLNQRIGDQYLTDLTQATSKELTQ